MPSIYELMREANLAQLPVDEAGAVTWNPVIAEILTVGRIGDQNYVYFKRFNGKVCRVKSDIAHRKFPIKLLQFYEANLRWKTVEIEVADEEGEIVE
ncbi:hypothetical protein C8R46DRAFT_1211244 [Mycena filopes]|nr:hypothetical protein C8R46DRAFT_1211244 [Mycena filopes]